jgi:hypothetical protein
MVFMTSRARRHVSRGGTTRWFPLLPYFGARFRRRGWNTRVTTFYQSLFLTTVVILVLLEIVLLMH